jgi:hypothetical protein
VKCTVVASVGGGCSGLVPLGEVHLVRRALQEFVLVGGEDGARHARLGGARLQELAHESGKRFHNYNRVFDNSENELFRVPYPKGT